MAFKFRRYTTPACWLAATLFFFAAAMMVEIFLWQEQPADLEAERLTRKNLSGMVAGGQAAATAKVDKRVDPEAGKEQSPSSIAAIDMEMSPEVLRLYKRLRLAKEEERSWQEITLGFNDGSAREGAQLKLHGWTSLASPAKSYSIKLKKKLEVSQDIELKRFFLINMLDDKGKFQTWFSYCMLAKLGLFPNYFQYVPVTINGESQGVYLLVERTLDALRRTEPALRFVARRRTDDGFIKKYPEDQSVPEWSMLENFIQLSQQDMAEADRRQAYHQLMDMEMYMSWLAYNALVNYPDSLDELFVYLAGDMEKQKIPLRIAVWDYDQLFYPPARPANIVDSPLLYATECRLGHAIAADPVFLAEYKKVVKRLLSEVLTEDSILAVLDRIQDEQMRVGEWLPPEERKAFLATGSREMELFRDRIVARRRVLLDLAGAD